MNQAHTLGYVDSENYSDAQRTLYLDDVKWYETDSGETDGYAKVAP
jgi:hypothetical protein